MKSIFLLLVDHDGMIRSKDEPFGVAVTSEVEARKFVGTSKLGYSRSYQEVKIFETQDEGVKEAYPWYKGDENETI